MIAQRIHVGGMQILREILLGGENVVIRLLPQNIIRSRQDLDIIHGRRDPLPLHKMRLSQPPGGLSCMILRAGVADPHRPLPRLAEVDSRGHAGAGL